MYKKIYIMKQQNFENHSKLVMGFHGFTFLGMMALLIGSIIALKAQDRAIRAEEKLRYFILTGKSMSNELSTRQIIGLRFASDDEFVDLVHKAQKEKMSEKEIKKSIKNWKADTYRV